MVGDQHVDALLGRLPHPLQSADAAVHRHEHVRTVRDGPFQARPRQVVAVPPTGHEAFGGGAEFAQPMNGQRGSGDPVGVVVAMHQNPFASLDGRGEPSGRFGRSAQAGRVQQVRTPGAKEALGLVWTEEASCGQKAAQRRRQSQALLQALDGLGRRWRPERPARIPQPTAVVGRSRGHAADGDAAGGVSSASSGAVTMTPQASQTTSNVEVPISF